MTWLQNRSPVSAASSVDPASVAADPCREAVGNICDESVTVRSAIDEVVLSTASVCVNVEYLCAELETSGSQRILRWPEDTGRLRIRIPAPPGVAPERARDLQSAAVRGIQCWQRRPFELVIDTHPIASEAADIEISWGEGLPGSQLNVTEFSLRDDGSGAKFEVQSRSLAHRSP